MTLDIDPLQFGLLVALSLTAFLMFLNSSVMVPPSEAICLWAGYWAAQNGSSWYLIAFVAAFANLLGTAPWYHLGLRHRETLARSNERKENEFRAVKIFRQLTRRDLDSFRPYFRGSGWVLVLVLRLVPVVRSIISYGAGRFALAPRTFYLSSFVGIQIWCALWVWAGYYFGLEPDRGAVARILLIFVAGIILLWLIRRFVLRAPSEVDRR